MPSSSSFLLSSVLDTLQNRRWFSLRRKTQKLDTTARQQLQNFLQEQLLDEPDDDNTEEAAEADYVSLGRQLGKLYQQQDALREKRDFLKTRLTTYESKLQALQDSISSKNGDHTGSIDKDGNTRVLQDKLKQSSQALIPIQETIEKLELQLEQLETKIESTQKRHLDLKLKTEECHVVLEELQHRRKEEKQEEGKEVELTSQEQQEEEVDLEHGHDQGRTGTDSTIEKIETTATELEEEASAIVQPSSVNTTNDNEREEPTPSVKEKLDMKKEKEDTRTNTNTRKTVVAAQPDGTAVVEPQENV
mmetsp:Transcript_9387/g.15069  ORF Transcript_9387/g.15069 Transcript_9387/m.15069 type:complete len:305 (+) Transcript_9387:182-1096(+)